VSDPVPWLWGSAPVIMEPGEKEEGLRFGDHIWWTEAKMSIHLLYEGASQDGSRYFSRLSAATDWELFISLLPHLLKSNWYVMALYRA